MTRAHAIAWAQAAPVVMLGLGRIEAYAGSLNRSRDASPGGQDEERLISACIRCEKCYERSARATPSRPPTRGTVAEHAHPPRSIGPTGATVRDEEHDGTPCCV